ncbi:PREDICTED: transcription initiation factor IIF subunit beta-like isoform X3 [Camelina sativa]|uniref:Transcription initiation factor IIF subunit beta-like isoform X1 n=1 Tax=Camelina sativa TaxID=90675 RepID=A0ABM0SUS9_CAMSA|nr:PREDICTED: transcription initiation factor IIF subunit beta-like isoform X1 [Camelina sativa]XP_010416443.1 PREDICTED: transcription initiation factor IIF subunit beta-like isoform X2 [Camelina sativa]XP_019083387.1 PREDICTED: transcription initiation factor IIF subunit beta-like isoform X3 [Camelina sativa]
MEDDRSNPHELDLEKGERPIWLMKCPVVVAKAWGKLTPPPPPFYSSSSESIDLAKVVLNIDPLRPTPEFTMEMVRAEYENMPKSYAVNMFKDFVPMEVFSDVNQVHTAVEGKVDHKFDMKPYGENIEEYARLCRERTSKAMVKNRQIQVIDNDRGVHMRPLPGMVGFGSSNSKEKKRPAPVKQTEVKRTRRDRGELEGIMFKLFEGQPNWTLKQLVQETDQPAQFLKEILNELCVYNKRGSNQGTYELKPEYKKSAEDDTGGQ